MKLFAVAFPWVVAFAGCGVPAPPPAPPMPAPAAQLPAIGAGDVSVGETSATFGAWGDGTAVIVWSAIPAGNTGSGTAGSAAEYNGLHLAPDGGRVEWECTTDDGRTGTVTINGEDYELDAGSLFLVGVEGDETTVVQLVDRDTLQLTDETRVGTMEDWLSNDDEIAGFFADTEN